MEFIILPPQVKKNSLFITLMKVIMLFAFVRFESVSCETLKVIVHSLINCNCLVRFQVSALKPKEFAMSSARK